MTDKKSLKPKKQRWYLGGFAGSGAVLFTHPLDLLKVHLQTQQKATEGLVAMGVKVYKNEGFLGLYNGVSASILRQMTYTTVRFGFYEIASSKLLEGRDDPLPFYQKFAIGCVSGFIGGIFGNPADMVNVRMQNDMKIAPELRRNYKHAVDGLYRVAAEEGVSAWMAGVTMTATRGLLMTMGQVAVYDQAKQMLMSTGYFGDTVPTHLASSVIAGTIATMVTQPFDVLKTRLMNAAPGQYKSVLACVTETAKVGPIGFYKGFIPAWVRLGPQTILTWLFLEQLRKMFPVEE
ncbi:mitochondrial dicarboxylate carrier-like [Rhopilema esculentum]|uniref:mitochondrial dicarboxylate carrier-like n=1 Tax=Rhopilema esculentum TaxID=499914 RepID=UPI0031E31C12